MQDRPPLKFTEAQFEAVHADRPNDSNARETLRNRWRSYWLPPALVPEEWRVVQSFRYWEDALHEGEFFDVPKAFIFDGASVPWPLTVLVPKTHPIYLGAAALHDFLYAERWRDVTRRRADDIFLNALLVSGLNWIWAGLMWRAVRAGGWALWCRRTDTPLGKLLRGPTWVVFPVRIAGTAVLGVAGILIDIADLIVRRSIYRKYAEIKARDQSS